MERRSYPEDLKRATAQRRLEGTSSRELAASLGVPEQAVHRWVRKYKKEITRAKRKQESAPPLAPPSEEARQRALAVLERVAGTENDRRGVGNELRLKALELLFTQPSLSITKIAADLGTSETNIYAWRKKYGREVAEALGVPYRAAGGRGATGGKQLELLSEAAPLAKRASEAEPIWARPAAAPSAPARSFASDNEGPTGNDSPEVELLRTALRKALKERDAFRTALLSVANDPGEE